MAAAGQILLATRRPDPLQGIWALCFSSPRNVVWLEGLGAHLLVRRCVKRVEIRGYRSRRGIPTTATWELLHRDSQRTSLPCLTHGLHASIPQQAGEICRA